MELVVLFIIAALVFFGPRKGGACLPRRSPKGKGGPSVLTIGLGLFFLLWFLVTMGFGTLWKHFFGTMSQP